MGLDGATDCRDGDAGVEDRLGALKDREPLLPEDRPPPTLARASISSIHMKKNKHVKMTSAIFCHFCVHI
jgi:hypothetical protein